jgi:Domain of unknown function (DUF1841)
VRYDGDRAPDAGTWRATTDDERVRAVEEHHTAIGAAHPATRNPRLHATLHVVVENQLALDDPPEVRRALSRLLAGGLGRHDAIHALASVVAEATHGALSRKRFDPRAYARALDALTAEGWRRGAR